MVVFRRNRAGHLELISGETPWWLDYFPLLLARGSSEAGEDSSYSFIGNFLEEAHDFWKKEKRGADRVRHLG